MRTSTSGFIWLLGLALLWGGAGCSHQEDSAAIAVGNSYLQQAVGEVYESPQKILRLVPAGMCPGDFDLTPHQARQLAQCRVLFIFPFQQGMAEKLKGLDPAGMKVGTVSLGEGMGIPEVYLATVGQITDRLAEVYPTEAATYRERLRQTTARLTQLGTEIQQLTARSDLRQVPVICSAHQAVFLRWLGLDVVATFSAGETTTPTQIQDCLERAQRAGVRGVIANRPEGTALAEQLAGRLSVPWVVCDNFPTAVGIPDGYDRMVRDNVQALLKALRP